MMSLSAHIVGLLVFVTTLGLITASPSAVLPQSPNLIIKDLNNENSWNLTGDFLIQNPANPTPAKVDHLAESKSNESFNNNNNFSQGQFPPRDGINTGSVASYVQGLPASCQLTNLLLNQFMQKSILQNLQLQNVIPLQLSGGQLLNQYALPLTTYTTTSTFVTKLTSTITATIPLLFGNKPSLTTITSAKTEDVTTSTVVTITTTIPSTSSATISPTSSSSIEFSATTDSLLSTIPPYSRYQPQHSPEKDYRSNQYELSLKPTKPIHLIDYQSNPQDQLNRKFARKRRKHRKQSSNFKDELIPLGGPQEDRNLGKYHKGIFNYQSSPSRFRNEKLDNAFSSQKFTYANPHVSNLMSADAHQQKFRNWQHQANPSGNDQWTIPQYDESEFTDERYNNPIDRRTAISDYEEEPILERAYLLEPSFKQDFGSSSSSTKPCPSPTTETITITKTITKFVNPGLHNASASNATPKRTITLIRPAATTQQLRTDRPEQYKSPITNKTFRRRQLITPTMSSANATFHQPRAQFRRKAKNLKVHKQRLRQ